MSLPDTSALLPVCRGRSGLKSLSFLLFGLSASAIGLLVCPGGCPSAPTAADPGSGTVVAGTTVEANPAPAGVADNIVPVTLGGGEIQISDQVLATMQGTPLTVVLEMDPSLVEVLEFSMIAPPQAGTVTESRNGGRIELTYNPNEGFFGQDEFRVDVSDGTSSSIASITVIVHPEVRFEAEVLSQQPVLLVEARAVTMAGHDLPAGAYTWYADSQPESGSVSTHASRQFSFATTGTHILGMTLTLAGMSTPISCSYGPEGNVKTATFRSQDGDVGPIEPRLVVTPDVGLQSSGDRGGPFNPDSTTYTVSNLGRQTMDWAAVVSQDWVSLSPAGGSLAMNESVNVDVRLNASANNLPAGNQQAEIMFKNLTKGLGHITRSVLLAISEPPQPAPGVLAVSPAEGLDSSGPEGDLFSPVSKQYTLTNTGDSPLDWTASKSAAWLDLSAGGSLDPGAFANVIVSINANANSLSPGNYGDAVTFTNTSNGSGNTTRDVKVTVIPPPANCITGSANWQNRPFAAQSGIFVAEFDAIPGAAGIDGVTGLSLGSASAYTDLAAIVRFNTSNEIDARDGGGYRATNVVPYLPGTSYHFRLAIDVPNHVYSVFVRPQGGSELTVASDFTFRTEQNNVTGLANWAVVASDGTHQVCDFSVPGGLSVTPAAPFNPSGEPGGPFTPASAVYLLTNTDTQALQWSASKSQPWLNLAPVSPATLAAGASVEVTVSLDSSASGLSPGQYADTVSFSNLSSGRGDTSRDVTVTVQTPGGGQMASSVSQWGITWTFDGQYEVGQFVTGDWWVVGPVSIIGISPATTIVSGRALNGSMLNPSPTNGANQGYDGMMYRDLGSHFYVAGLNVAIGVDAQTPLDITTGSLVSTISTPDPLPPIQSGPDKYVLEYAAVLTVVTSAPATNAFRPPYAGSDKTSHWSASQMRFDRLSQLTPASGAPSFGSLEDATKYVFIDHVPDWMGADYVHTRNGLNGYGRDFSSAVGRAALLINCAYPNNQKQALLTYMIQIGIDSHGVLLDGGQNNWRGAGGETSGRYGSIVLAGWLLDDPAMMNVGANATVNGGIYRFGDLEQTYYVTQADVNRVHHYADWRPNGQGNPPYEDDHGAAFVDYVAGDIGLAEWGIEHQTNPDQDNKNWGATYRACCTANSWQGQLLAAHAMGIRALWQHDAIFDYEDRYMNTQAPGWMRAWDSWTGSMWDLHRASYP